MRHFLAAFAWTAVLTVSVAVLAAEPPPSTVRSWQFERDADGRLKLRHDPAGRVAQYHYNSNHNLERVDYSDGSGVAYAYTANGQRESMTDSTGTTRYEFDALGRPKSVSFPADQRVNYQYDLRGRLRRIELSDGWWMAYEYDLFGRLVAVDSKIGRVQYAYFPNNRANGRVEPKTVRSLPNGITTTWNFDADLRLVSLRHERAGTVLIEWSYEYDGLERVISISESPGRTQRRYSYDSLGRLTEVSVNGSFEEKYEYDAGSNQVFAKRRGESVKFTHNAAGELEAVGTKRLAYNPAGELVRRESVPKAEEYRYDAEGRLLAVSGANGEIQYEYDGDGNLTRRRSGGNTERYVFDVAVSIPRLLAVFDADEQPMRHYVLGPNRVAVVTGSGDVTYLLEDHLQSVRLLIDGNGQALAARDYSAFGHPLTAPEQSAGFGFAGEWRDPESGLMFLRSRWYDPQVGRFISPDLMWGELDRPASLNRYAYAENDPINRVDPTGLFQLPPPPPPPPPPRFDFFVRRPEVSVVSFFPGASRPADQPVRLPDYYRLSITRDVPGAVRAAGSIIVDRYGQVYVGGQVSVSVGKEIRWVDFMPGRVRLAPGWVGTTQTPTPQMLHDRLTGFNMTFRDSLPRLYGVKVGSTIDVEFGNPMRPFSASASGVVALSDIGPGISRGVDILASHFAIPRPAEHGSGFSGLSARDVAQVLARDPYHLYSREHGEAKAADLYERLAHSSPLRHGDVWRDWVMGAEYTGIRELQRGPQSLGPDIQSVGGRVDHNPPNVGGVYLQGMAEMLGRMGAIQGVVYDRDTNRLALLAERGEAKSSGIRADDLAVALRAAMADEWPGISIDPDPANPRGPTMHYRYIGPTEGTSAGLVVGLADRWMKVIGLGQDNENAEAIAKIENRLGRRVIGLVQANANGERKVRPNIPDFKDQFGWAFELSSNQRELWCRFWLVPDKMQWQVSPNGKTLWCSSASIKVNTQVMELVNGRPEPANGRTDPASERFADFFTKHYDELAHEYPVYEELRQLAKLVGLAAWLKTQLSAEQFTELANSLSPSAAETPTTTPTLTLTREDAQKRLTLTIFGGVDLEPKLPSQLPKSAELADIATELNREPKGRAGSPIRDITVGDRSYHALEIPLTTRSNAGRLALQATDLVVPVAGEQPVLLSRHYDSMNTSPGAFGRGWQLIVPELRIQLIGGRGALYLTDTAGTSRVAVPESDSSRKSGPVVEATLTATDGSVWEFGRNRKLRTYRSRGINWEYEYAGELLKHTKVRRGGELLWDAEFSYSPRGQIVAAQDQLGRKVTYQYDDLQRLVEVRAGETVVRYGYDKSNHLASIEQGTSKQSFQLDDDGFLVRTTDENGKSTEYRRESLADGGSRIRTSGADATVMDFDSQGRPTRVQQGEQILNVRWGADGGSQEYLVRGEAVARVQYDAARNMLNREIPGDRRETYLLSANGTPKTAEIVSESDGSRVQVEFDELGKPIAMTDPAGGEYRRQDRGENEHEIITPSGRHSISIDKAGRSVTLRSPSGKEWRWGSDADNQLSTIESGGRKWTRTAPQSWELTDNDHKSVATLRTDDSGNVAEMKVNSGGTVRATHGEGGTVVTTPEGRQLVVRRDSTGQIAELQEHPAGTPTPHVPLPELTGKRKVTEKLEKLQPLKKH